MLVSWYSSYPAATSYICIHPSVSRWHVGSYYLLDGEATTGAIGSGSVGVIFILIIIMLVTTLMLLCVLTYLGSSMLHKR